jgi:hypothetical protein
MASSRRRTKIPGLPAEASQELVSIQDGLLALIAELRQEAVGETSDSKVTKYSARYNEFIRCLPPTAGLDITFPAADTKTPNRWIWILKVGGGDVRLKAVSGNIQGVTTVQTLTTNGLYIYQSDGLNSWWTTVGGGGGGLTPPVALTDLANIADETFLGNVSGAGAPPSAILLSSLAGTGLTWNSALNRLDASGGGAASMTDATITLGFTGAHNGTAVVADAAIGAASNVGIFWGDVLDTDENSPEMDAVTFTCIPAAGSMTVRVSSDKAPVGGAYKIRYLIG